MVVVGVVLQLAVDLGQLVFGLLAFGDGVVGGAGKPLGQSAAH